MKRIFAILLLLLLLFNLVGYRLLFNHLEQNAQVQLAAVLDKQAFHNADLFEIKVPLNLPYFNNSEALERYDGSIEVQGLHYNYVEREVINDTLVLLCIPNTAQNNLSNSQNDYAKTCGNIQYPSGPRSNAASLLLAMLITGCSQQNIAYQSPFINIRSRAYPTFNEDAACIALHLSPEQPPELA